ncbi:hypothetical protein [Streptomyces sp. NPDC127098]|uniref:hypothetical protein n=1 Tax=Streptomyces sp. NPDC127098 TaxID=3347137 RepID=UPI003658BBC2
MRYEARHSTTRGWYVVSDEGHLAHVPDPETSPQLTLGGAPNWRAALFERQEDAERCAAELTRLGQLS